MTLRLYIPSMGRAHVPGGPLAQMTPGVRALYQATIVVPDAEVNIYQAYNRFSYTKVIGCPETGIARTRQWIAKHCDTNKFVMMDDDINFIVRVAPDDWKLREAYQNEVHDMMVWIEGLLETYGHVSVSTRQGNNRLPTGSSPIIVENSRTLRVLAYRRDDFLSVEHGRVEVMEDFDVNLQLLRKGIANCQLAHWAQDQKMTNAPGGCSTYRTHEVHERSARKLADLHPGIVTLRQKENKTDRAGFGTRTEVTIQWKKAISQAR